MELTKAKEEIKNRIDIVDYIGKIVKLEKRGINNYFGLCPFHSEKTPSFCVDSSRQMFYCFGCQKGGDIFKFVEYYFNMSFIESVKYFADMLNIVIDSNNYDNNEQDKKVLLEIYKNVANEYYKFLFSPKGKNGLSYIKKRKINFEMIKKFGLGYAPNDSSIYKIIKNKNIEEKYLEMSGLFTYKNENDVYDKFYDRVMFPIMDLQGKVIAFGGRRIDGEKEFKYVNSPETIIFKKSNVLYGMNFAKSSNFDYFIFCEGNVDVIPLHQVGYTNAIAMLGVGIHDSLVKQMLRFKKKIVLSLDTDETGVKTTIKSIDLLKKYGISVKVLNLLPAKDVDEFINKYGRDELQIRINEATDGFLFKISQIKKKYNLDDLQDYNNYINDIISNLLTIDEKIVRDKYIKLVSRQENIDEIDLKNSVDKHNIKKENTSNNYNTNIEYKQQKVDIIEPSHTIKEFISILIDYNEFIKNVKNYISVDYIVDESMKNIYDDLLNGLNKNDLIEKYQQKDDEISKYILKFIITDKNNLDYSRIPVHLKELIKRILKQYYKYEQSVMIKNNNIEQYKIFKNKYDEIDKLEINFE